MPGPNGPWGDAARRRRSATAACREAAIDDKVRRLLRLAARVGALEGVAPAAPAAGRADGRRRRPTLLREARPPARCCVRNEAAVLPLDRGALRRVAVIGPNAATARTQGGGSATVHPDHVVSPLDGLRAALGDGVEVVHAAGARIRQGLEPLGSTTSATR